MKKLIKSMLMLSMASLVILTSCEEDTNNGEIKDVEITINPSPSTSLLTVGTQLTLSLELKGNTDNKLKKVTVTSSASSAALLSKTLSGTSATEILKDTINVVGTITYTVILEGDAKDAKKITKTYVVTGIAPPGPIIQTNNSIELFDRLTTVAGTSRFVIFNQAFAQVTLDNFEANKTAIDIGYFRGSSNANTLASPDAAALQGLYTGLNWTGVSKTKIAKTTLTVAQYDAITNDSLISATAATAAWNSEGIANTLAKNNILVFETADGIQGFIRVDDISTTGEPTLSLSVKMQE